LTRLMCDLGNGIFDASWLVANFDNLSPANTLTCLGTRQGQIAAACPMARDKVEDCLSNGPLVASGCLCEPCARFTLSLEVASGEGGTGHGLGR
jgi:Protein of unknown function (DUF3141)